MITASARTDSSARTLVLAAILANELASRELESRVSAHLPRLDLVEKLLGNQRARVLSDKNLKLAFGFRNHSRARAGNPNIHTRNSQTSISTCMRGVALEVLIARSASAMRRIFCASVAASTRLNSER